MMRGHEPRDLQQEPRRIQEEWALNAHARPKMNFTWAKENVKT